MNQRGPFTSPSGFDQQMSGDDFWHHPNTYTHCTDAAQPTQAAPFFQDYYGHISGYGGDLKAHGVDSFSGQDIYPHYQAPNPPSQLYNFTQRPRPAQTSLPPTKRQKIRPIVEPCDQDGTQSECCSSCPSGTACDEPNCTPCEKPDCDESEQVIPCTRKSCVEPVCPNPCLNVAVQQQEANLKKGVVPTERRLLSWENTQWNSEVPRSQGIPSLNNLLDPALEDFRESKERPVSGSPTPTTPSKVKNGDTPHSATGEAPTPHNTVFTPLTEEEAAAASILSGAGALFNPAMDSQWQDFGHQTPTNYQSCFECKWTGCENPIVDPHDYFSHFHTNHIDPQMTFGCPALADSCPSAFSKNPMEHLQNDHGYNFNMGTGGLSCPDPTCLPGETFLNPSMLHNHLDSYHSNPAHGVLQCRLESCGSYHPNFDQLWSHVIEEHEVPQQSKTTDIDLGFPTAPIPATEALMKGELPTIETKVDVEAEKEVEDDHHICKWKLSPGVVCSMECESENDLQKHIKTAHLDSLDKKSGYKCQWEGCNREEKLPKNKIGFTQRGKLERHMATHTNYKSSFCDWPGCGKFFSAPQAMKQHYLLHTGEKPWECKHCGKKFPQQSACTIHERTHTKEKPLECKICGMKFSESSNLSKHRRTHEEKQSHECTFKGCGKSFCRLDQLRRHKQTHYKKKKEDGEESESVTESVESSTA